MDELNMEIAAGKPVRLDFPQPNSLRALIPDPLRRELSAMRVTEELGLIMLKHTKAPLHVQLSQACLAKQVSAG